MSTYRLTFQSATNLSIPYSFYDVIYHDACYFGYLKGDTPNINGFLNHLIPSLSDFHDNLHRRFYAFLGGDEDSVRAVEQSIHHVYLDPFDIHYAASIKIPFRVTKKYMNDFLKIHDVKLDYYRTDFSNYVRNLLAEYTSRTISQRECLFAYRMLPVLSDAVAQGLVCRFYCKNEVFSFVPICLETSPATQRTLICGISPETNDDIIVALASVLHIIPETTHCDFSEEECASLYEYIEKFIEKEQAK